MNVLQNLTQLYNQLPSDSTYKDVAEKILTNLEEVSNATIYDAAELTNASRTTLWRLVQKMGYENYSDFRHALKQAVSQYTYYNRILLPEQCTDADTIISSCLHQTKLVRSLIEKNIKSDMLVELAQICHEADHIAFYFPYQIYTIASFQQNLAMSGIATSYCCLHPEMLENVQALTDKSIIIIDTIDYAESLDMTEIFSLAKQIGAKVFRMSRSGARYQMYTDKILLDFNPGNDIGACLSTTIMYFLMLSEIYRHLYLN